MLILKSKCVYFKQNLTYAEQNRFFFFFFLRVKNISTRHKRQWYQLIPVK